MEKKEPWYTVVGNVNWCNHYGNSTEIPLKIKNRTIKDPAVLAIVTQKYVDNLPQWEFHQQSAGPTLTDTEGHGQIHPLKITPVGLRTCHAVPGGHR